MTKPDFDKTMDRFLDGAARVRAKKHQHRDKPVSSRIISKIWREGKGNTKAA